MTTQNVIHVVCFALIHPCFDFDPFEPKKHMRIYKKPKQNTIKFADPNKNEEYYNKKYKIDQEGIEF